MWQFWLIAAGIFMVAEMFTMGFLVFWLGLGALLTMIVSFFTSNIIIQTTVFVISSTILIFATKPLVNRFTKKDNTPTNVYSIVGKKALVIQDIDWANSTGQIKVNGEVWSAKTDEQINIPKDSEVQIERIEGVKAYVTPLNVVTKN